MTLAVVAPELGRGVIDDVELVLIEQRREKAIVRDIAPVVVRQIRLAKVATMNVMPAVLETPPERQPDGAQ
jgi:hypothetical protein